MGLSGTSTAVAVSITPNGTATAAQIGSPITLAATPGGSPSFFPPPAAGTGSVGVGGTNVALAAMPGAAAILNCNGTTFTLLATFSEIPNAPPSVMSNPVAVESSYHSSTAVPGLIYVLGSDNGTSALYAYSQFSNSPVFSLTNVVKAGGTPTAMTAGY
jgi:hypothetical protein